MKALLVSLAFAFALCGCKKARTACVYEIPEGFTGWILIEFGRTNCPPLMKRDGKLVFEIGRDGRLCTSSPLQYGWAKVEYFYVGKARIAIPCTVSGGGGLIWGSSTGSTQTGNVERKFESFFVGPEDQFTQADKQPTPK